MKLFASAAGIFCLFSTTPACGQDLPLSAFLVDGEGWKVATVAVPATPPPLVGTDVPNQTAAALTPDRGTVYVASAAGRYVWALRWADGKPAGGGPYALLWARRGQKDQPVSALLFDARGCLYAATADGVQIFDPTGRLCGVVPLPVKGLPTAMGWTGEKHDVLVVAVDDVVFTRKMKVPGAT